MKAVAQLVHTLSYGDAISGEVLALDNCLRTLGFDPSIYCLNAHPRLKERAKRLEELPRGFDGEMILHYSLGSPLNKRYSEESSAHRSLIYHNLTPAFWFEGVNPRVVQDIESGVSELPGLLSCTDLILADSPFNASELASLGFQAEVLELPIDPTRWNVDANEGIASLLANDPGIHLLHVGRLAPNKCVEDLIKIFYFLHHYIEPKSKLWLAGIDIDTELYSYSLKRLVHELSLNESVKFVGALSDEEIRALYQNATVYGCMSEHEGFCLPVIEAMHFGLPVVAYASSALPHTVGDGGILVKEKRHAELAELFYKVATDATLRSGLIAAGKKRVASLSYEIFQSRVEELFLKRERLEPASVAAS